MYIYIYLIELTIYIYIINVVLCVCVFFLLQFVDLHYNDVAIADVPSRDC